MAMPSSRDMRQIFNAIGQLGGTATGKQLELQLTLNYMAKSIRALHIRRRPRPIRVRPLNTNLVLPSGKHARVSGLVDLQPYLQAMRGGKI